MTADLADRMAALEARVEFLSAMVAAVPMTPETILSVPALYHEPTARQRARGRA